MSKGQRHDRLVTEARAVLLGQSAQESPVKHEAGTVDKGRVIEVTGFLG